jgi:hypothetical protein
MGAARTRPGAGRRARCRSLPSARPPARRRIWYRLLPGLLAAAAVFPAASRAAAHELGPFQVYGSFGRDGAFRLDIKVDEEHLPAAAQGGPARLTRYGRIAGLAGPTEQRFGRYLSDLADSLTVSFDGVPVRPVLAMDPEGGGVPGGLARATLRVEGWIPGGARVFSFASSLPVKSYPLVLSYEGDESSTWRWVAGGETSPPYRLAARVVPPTRGVVARRWFAAGFARVLPHGALQLLLVAAVFLLTRRPGPALALLGVLALGQALGLTLEVRAGAVRAPAAPGAPGMPGTPGLPWALGTPARIDLLLALATAGLGLAGAAGLGAGAAGGARDAARPAAGAPGLSADATSQPSSTKGATKRALPRAVWLPAAVLLIGALSGVSLAEIFRAAPVASDAVAAGRAALALPPPWLGAALAGLAAGATAAELAALAAALALIGLPFRGQPWYRSRVVVPAGSLIAVVGLYWSLAALLS